MFDYSHDSLATGTIESMLDQYIDTALWTAVDMETMHPMDLGREFLSPQAEKSMREDVTNFLAACWGDVWEDYQVDLSGIEPEQLGVDFWLTRNGHGAGFWDRGLGEIGVALTELSKSYGASDLYLGDDGLLYVYPVNAPKEKEA